MINYDEVEILNTPDNVVKLMTDVFEINKKKSGSSGILPELFFGYKGSDKAD